MQTRGCGSTKKNDFLNTSIFGIKETPINREVLDRYLIKVEVLGETIRCKVGIFEGKIVKAVPEYEDCRIAALKTGAGYISASHCKVKRIFCIFLKALTNKYTLNIIERIKKIGNTLQSEECNYGEVFKGRLDL